MFTNKKAKYNGDNKVLIDAACLSADTKPTTGIANGSKCIEMDTGKTFMFNEEDSEWEELPSSGGGGGGSSDFSTAEVTVVNNTNYSQGVALYGGINMTSAGSAFIYGEGLKTLVGAGPNTTGNFTALLLKTTDPEAPSDKIALYNLVSEGGVITPTVTGDGVLIGEEAVVVFGDCTITIS